MNIIDDFMKSSRLARCSGVGFIDAMIVLAIYC